MASTAFRSACLALALLAPALAAAQPADPAPAPSGFQGLWTGWRDANAVSMRIERGSVEQVRRDVATADPERRDQLRNQGRALGERVGEIVRLGDCAEGERIARDAGDFALVEAVRTHCATPSAPRP
ncbi:MAG TPA: hypothetical protein VN231_10565 [Allosphingosinicella sp.]|nr:hypothetical protein [Allosphingosinicella sp.]